MYSETNRKDLVMRNVFPRSDDDLCTVDDIMLYDSGLLHLLSFSKISKDASVHYSKYTELGVIVSA